MGISGLLPLLKSIQVNRHLSEYSGQTIAVDAYVWLHRGTYACAPDLATGRKTNRYVDYAMHRVRLLQHHNITPYIVFDGGPLPAKKGTESDRKKRRDENLARANALAAQGKHTQAREYYVKCIDVSPQMAYQFIKALRAENVAYVVAPYEADAQMAYLERIGLVSGILTEDSDMLVFGCKQVLLKLDSVESTVISISRTDFASMVSSAGGGISLYGWSDVQFRAMAILSGCDYLASIPGVGLKTAWALLRKHGTADNVIRALQIEGKKNVPKGYLQAFRLAEKVFLHQRVYDPLKHKLVNLGPTPDGEEWDEEKEAHVGRDIEPSLAQKVAEGDACPINLLPMEDINPTFAPRALKLLPLNNMSTDAKLDPKRKGKEKLVISEKVRSSSILTFFTPRAKEQARPVNRLSQSAAPLRTTRVETPRPIVGQASGKRTLAEVMDHDIVSKRQKRKDLDAPSTPSGHLPASTRSKFFSAPSSGRSRGQHVPHDDGGGTDIASVAGPSGLGHLAHNKENIPCVAPADELDEGEISVDEVADPVTQEDGYMSPSPSFSRWDSPELSSPSRSQSRSSKWPTQDVDEDDDISDADVLSSPIGAAQQRSRVAGRPRRSPSPFPSAGNILVHGTPTRSAKRGDAGSPARLGPDLRDIFETWSDGTSDIDEGGEESLESMESFASSSEPVTPESSTQHVVCVDDSYDAMTDDIEEIERQTSATRNDRIANGWWERWACQEPILANKQSRIGTLRRRETTVTPEGRHCPRQSTSKQSPQHHDLRSANRRSLLFMPQTKAIEKSSPPYNSVDITRPGSSGSERAEGVILEAKARLAEFRYVAT